ncbi:probable galactinol--sucrose galactosyltransferase 2 [Andrographis paniculata]|uniref:probable galactinol--sucrose galactosyltransferase 2 n=1 Tax=Andrographis paniculata TaxID=175694 RepID=UPI0021E8CBA4|nr:probable galactinol--sucrose galactosyltransferase 2 [Andrographis paniculata]
MAVCASSLRTLQWRSSGAGGNVRSSLAADGRPERLLRFRKSGGYGVIRRRFVLTTAAAAVEDRCLRFGGTAADALVDVPENVVITPHSESSAFLGAAADESRSRHVFKLGLIEGTRLLSLFRFKIWWMIPRVGNSARDIPVETQMLLLEAGAGYILFLPLVAGEYRSSLQGNSADELQVCVETGDSAIIASSFPEAVFVSYGQNPFDLIKESMKILQKHTGAFALRETKQIPGILDWFGWCTWDAFYHDVNPKGIRDGLKSLSEGGTPARFLIIDDGWQDTTNEFAKDGEPFVDGIQFAARLMSVEENAKFRKAPGDDSVNTPHSLKDFVSEIKTIYSIKYVYVWHALMGYWGGLHPDAPGTKKYNPTIRYPIQSPGNLAHSRDLAMDAMEAYGVGTVDPEKASGFYNDMHSYLVAQGVDGVKVDVQNILETLATGLGGRVPLTRHFQQCLQKSVSENFSDNGLICCMAQNTDSVYSSSTSAMTRASDDYYPNNPRTQTLHIASVAYNSLFFGEVLVPDWDMFYSLHEAAEFHAVARAVGGCGVYISDKPGKHDFKILKRLVLPDGSVLRAKHHGRPTRDCLFSDPVMDGTSLMKIWNMNKVTGVLAVFNCQGAGTWPGLQKSIQVENSELSGHISPSDIDYLAEISPRQHWNGDYAVYSFQSGTIGRLSANKKIDVTYKTLQCDIFTVSPIEVYYDNLGIEFAPIGLIDMYNSGGAVDSIEAAGDSKIRIRGRGEGVFGGFSSSKPKTCFVNGKNEHFDIEDNIFKIRVPIGTCSWVIDVHY